MKYILYLIGALIFIPIFMALSPIILMVTLVALGIGLKKPYWLVKTKDHSKRTKATVLKWYGSIATAALISIIVVVSFGMSESDDKANAQEVVEQTQHDSIETPKDNKDVVEALGNEEKATQPDVEKQEPEIEDVKEDKSVNAKLHFINTGQSDCVLIESDGEFMLIDGGDKDDDATVKAYLQKVGVNQLKYVVATHFHADHLGGLDTIVRDFGVETVFVPNGDADTAVYREFIQSCTNRNLQPSVPLPDAVFELGNSTFRFLNVKGGYSNANDNSLVVELTSGEIKSLFTGDAEKEVEQVILNELTDIDILKVAHHGSSSSTTDMFLDKVKPEVAVIQTAVGNKYGHPHVETMQKLKTRGITVHRNDECGDIVYSITNEGYTTDCKVSGSYDNGNKSDNAAQTNNSVVETPKPTPVPEQNTSTPNSKIVYITNTGSKYHKDGCRHLKSRIESTISDAKAQGLEPCGTCKP